METPQTKLHTDPAARCLLCLDFEERAAEFDRQCRIEFEFMERARAAAAEKIVEWRAAARKIMAGSEKPLPETLRVKLLHAMVKGYHTPMKPSRRNLRRAAIMHLQYSRTQWSNPHDSEYYSA